MTDTFLKASINKSLMEVDGLVGLPNGVKPEPITYNLGKINEYLKMSVAIPLPTMCACVIIKVNLGR